MKRLARFVMRGCRRRVGAAGTLEARPKLLVFDFDGTIADTFESALEILNVLANEFRFRPLKPDEVARARDMRTPELMSFLGIPARKMRRISMRGTEELSKRIGTIVPLPGMPELLRSAKAEGFALGILTSNIEANVHAFLKKYDLEIFDFVRSSSKLMGKGRVIRRILKDLSLRPCDILLVGDETRDIDAAQETGVHIAAVTWGYNSRHSIEAAEPDHLFDSTRELLGLLRKYPHHAPPASRRGAAK